MDWLRGMNKVIEYIEENITESIDYDMLAKMMCCSSYEFGRIFSFMVGIPISEYVRKRRLSLAAFDLQDKDMKIIDIALKYCYESPGSFSRAFKEMHGTPPIIARREGISLKTYPKLSFKFSIKGVEEMNFRIVEKEAFSIVGLKGVSTSIADKGQTLDPMWTNFMNEYDSKLWNDGDNKNFYTSPLWQVGAYWNDSEDGKTTCIIGAELLNNDDKSMTVEAIEACKWVVFSFTGPAGTGHDEAYARINTEWFPTSKYKRRANIQHLEVYPPGDGSLDTYQWEIWMPIIEGND